jgi:hypothetical protein
MFDIHQPVFNRTNDELDERALEEYIDGLMEEFAASDEAKPILEEYGSLGWPAMMLDYTANYLGLTPPRMTARDFREVVFEIFPRKVSTEADSAPAIIAELRAFWQFLKRAYQLTNADAILKTLEVDATDRLTKALSDPRNFGMAKSFFMMGQQLGYDMTTKEGIDAFTQQYNSQLAGRTGAGPLSEMIPAGPYEEEEEGFDDEPPMSLPPSQTPKQRAEQRKKHKAQRQAKKKNRRKK